jgi:hypothetical protein
VAGPVEVIIDGQAQLREPESGGFRGAPRPERRDPGFVRRGECLGGIWPPMPALLIAGDRRRRRQGGEEPIIRGIEAGREPCGGFRGIGGQPRVAEEPLAARCPRRVGQEEIVELAEAGAPPNPDVAALALVAQGRQDGACVGAALAGAVGPYTGRQALRETGNGPLLRPGPAPAGMEVAQEAQGV